MKGAKVRCTSFSHTHQLSLLITFFHLPNRLVFSCKVFSQAKVSLLPVSFLPRGVGSAGRTGTGSGWGPVMEQEQISVWIRACRNTQLDLRYRCTECFLRHLRPFHCPKPDVYYYSYYQQTIKIHQPGGENMRKYSGVLHLKPKPTFVKFMWTL